MRTSPIAVLSLFVALVGCHGRSTGSDPGTTTTTSAEKSPADLLPPELAGKIHFEAATVKSKSTNAPSFTVMKPTGWSELFPNQTGWLKTDDRVLGHAEMHYGTDCDGSCSPKAWKAIIDKSFSDNADPKAKVLSEEQKANTHLRVAESSSGTTFVRYARWKDGADMYLSCSASLDGQYKTAWKSFAAACESLHEM